MENNIPQRDISIDGERDGIHELSRIGNKRKKRNP